MALSESTDDLWAEYVATRDPLLRNRLVMQYSPLVKYVAGRIRTGMPESVDQDDLVSDGVIGLMDAIERFQPERGLTFQTFAVPRIRGAIIDGMRSMDFVPRSVRDKVRAINRARIVLEDKLARSPDDHELATEAGLSVSEMRDLSKRAGSSHANVDDFDLSDDLVGAVHQEVEDIEFSAALRKVVGLLSERDQILIALYYFEGFTFAEIGRVFGVTESRVSQLHRRATNVLRDKLAGHDAG
jgi:RNA polymerase sigma factor for flagellar operon FliA